MIPLAEGVRVKLHSEGLMELADACPEDFEKLRSRKLSEGEVVNPDNGAGAATVKFAEDLALTIPLSSVTITYDPRDASQAQAQAAMVSQAVAIRGASPSWAGGVIDLRHAATVHQPLVTPTGDFGSAIRTKIELAIFLTHHFSVIGSHACVADRAAAPPVEGDEWKMADDASHGKPSRLTPRETETYETALAFLAEQLKPTAAAQS